MLKQRKKLQYSLHKKTSKLTIENYRRKKKKRELPKKQNNKLNAFATFSAALPLQGKSCKSNLKI